MPTIHVVLAENTKGGSPRTFVLVKQKYDTKGDAPEKRNICATLTAERVRRVIKGYDYVKRGPKGKTTKAHEDGLDGSFSYARVGEPLFGEYKNFGDKLPSFEDVAKYVFYTETSRQIDLERIDEETGFIGEAGPHPGPLPRGEGGSPHPGPLPRGEGGGGTSYYLLYTPNQKADREMSLSTLKALLKKDKRRNWVIYCEKIWVHPEDLRKFEREHGKRVRTMLVPFDLK